MSCGKNRCTKAQKASPSPHDVEKFSTATPGYPSVTSAHHASKAAFPVSFPPGFGDAGRPKSAFGPNLEERMLKVHMGERKERKKNGAVTWIPEPPNSARKRRAQTVLVEWREMSGASLEWRETSGASRV